MSDKENKKKKQDVAEKNEQPTESTEKNEKDTEDLVVESEATESETNASLDETCVETEQTPESKIAELEKENADLKDKYLRKTADFDNCRKRMQREKQETYEYANTNLLTDLITIMDDFDRALAAGVDNNGKVVEDLKPVVDGIKMINKQMKSTLENKYNLEGYAEKGDVFDHDIHEAIGKCEGAVAEPICSEVYSKGYKLKDRVIRPAKVMVTMPDGSIGE